MKNRIFNLLAAFLMLPAFSVFMTAANSVQTVSQVTGTVSLTAAVDYTITGEEPFADGAVLDIVNTEEAVVILPSVKPSEMLAEYLGHIRINGAKAVKNSNCMVKMYADGCILLPHGTGIRPLTVYTEKGQAGKSAQFAVSTHQSLAGHAMNNKIQSFTLKRGYMVWFGTKSSTHDPGYNRVFIADKADITVDLPAILSNSISALRVSQWNDASKKGFCSWRAEPNDLLNTTWHYNWDAGYNPSDDFEYVTQHHHEGWPGITEVGNNGTSSNILGNNEPDNTGDEREQVNSVAEVLATWPQMMATGRRLGSPAMSSNLNWLYEFMDSIDARGWRCDFVVMHCYWYSDWGSWKSSLTNVHNRTGRPIWITEMNYGANWTGWPGNNTGGNPENYAIHLQHFAPIVDGLEDTKWLERYCVYNDVQDCRRVFYTVGQDPNMTWHLTPSGEYYANKKSGMAYNPTYNVVPKLPKMKSPTGLLVDYDSQTTTATITWREYNGEYNESINVQRRTSGSSNWETIATVTPQEGAANYTYQDTEAMNGYQYRILVVDAAGKELYTPIRQAVLENVNAGDAIQVNGVLQYAGGNLLADGDFDLGALGWTDGEGNPVNESAFFSVFPVGGVDGGAYFHARTQKNSTLMNAEALKFEANLEPGRNYYFSIAALAGSTFHRLQLTGDTGNPVKKDSTAASLKTSDTWAYQEFGFNAGTYSQAIFSAPYMGGKTQLDKVVLCPLFDTKAEAIAHGVAAARIKAGYINSYLTGYPELQAELQDVLAATEGGEPEDDAASLMTLQLGMEAVVQGARAKDELAVLIPYAEKALALNLDGHESLQMMLERAKQAALSTEYVECLLGLQAELDYYLPTVYATDIIAAPDFNRTTVGWTVKCGTYKGGDQRMNSNMAGKSCWNAWWSGFSATEGTTKTMEIRQTVKNLPHGVYSLECKAGTQNNCLTDQHAYLVMGEDTLVSANLTYDRLDLPTVADSAKWETLVTPPVYVGDRGELTLGFVGSKQGAVDNAWREIGNMTSTGDKREGWWCATDFALRFIPMYRTRVPEGGWGLICLPRVIKPSARVKLYHVEGILADYTALCLQEVTETEAGVPYVYYTDEAEVNFYEEGEAVDLPSTSDPVWGDFYGNLEAFPGEYYLENGQWHRATAEKTAMIWPYTGFIPSALDFTVYQSWEGLTMPINGAVEEHAQSIRPVLVDGQPTTATDGCYTLNGTAISEQQAKQYPIYIRVKDGRAVKVVRM